MMKIYWLEQSISDVPLDDEWLSQREQLVLAGMRIAKRRADWRLGRWTAKRAVAAYLQLSLEAKQLVAIEVRPAASGAPEVFFENQSPYCSISLSHRDGVGSCAVVPPGGIVGCDLELVEPHSEAFLTDYFTPEEQASVARSLPEQRDRLLAVLWSAKESALKALRTGLRADTRTVWASITDMDSKAAGEWHPLSVESDAHQVFAGWWNCTDRLVRTVVSVPLASPPISLVNSEVSVSSRL
jgi:4'-phosphopantetheinyl transferase